MDQEKDVEQDSSITNEERKKKTRDALKAKS